MEEQKFKSILTNPEIKLEYITDKQLTFDVIRNNPILKPVSEINKNYCDLHLTVTKAILEYEDEYKKIQEMEVINPRYTNTVLMATIKNMITLMKTIVHSQDLQNISMRGAINEMIDISDTKYKFIDDEREKVDKIRADVRKEMEKEYKDKINSPQETKLESSPKVVVSDLSPVEPNEEDIIIADLKKIAGEGESEKKEVIPNKPRKVYSTLLEREL